MRDRIAMRTRERLCPKLRFNMFTHLQTRARPSSETNRAFKIINSLRPGAGLKSVVASNFIYEIVTNVSFFPGHAPKHYSFTQPAEHSSSNVQQRLPHHRTPRFLVPLQPQRYSRSSSLPSN